MLACHDAVGGCVVDCAGCGGGWWRGVAVGSLLVGVVPLGLRVCVVLWLGFGWVCCCCCRVVCGWLVGGAWCVVGALCVAFLIRRRLRCF